MKLRAYRAEDAAEICTWLRTEAELYQWAADRYDTFPLTAEAINANYAPQTAAGRFFPLTAVDENETVIGHFIIRYPAADRDDVVRFGFVIVDPALRGKGCGREMLLLGLDYARTHLHAERVTLGVFAENRAAGACYRSVGFKETGSENCVLPSGSFECLELEYAMIK